RRDHGTWCATVLPKGLIEFYSQFINRQARRQHIGCLEIVDHAIRCYSHLRLGQLRLRINRQCDHVARSKGQVLLPGCSLSRTYNGKRSVLNRSYSLLCLARYNGERCENSEACQPTGEARFE